MQQKNVRFTAQEGQQAALFHCPFEDILYGGARGGGKSFGMLGHFDTHQQEFGQHAKGIIFRRTYPELEDIIADAKKLYTQIDDNQKAIWNDSKKVMKFPNGANLKFRFLERDEHAQKYQGHAYSWICIEEAGNFPSPIPIDKLRACLRSAAGIKKFFLLTANPGGCGHNWIKAQYIDPAQPEHPFKVTKKAMLNGEEIEASWYRIFIPAKVTDNKILMDNDPNYISNIVASAGGQDWLLKAWLDGDWNIVAGGMFDDLWNPAKHILPSFKVPNAWRVYRSFDWGSSKPFSVGWWAISDGGHCLFDDGEHRIFKAGTLIRISEWYGWNGTPDTGLRLLESEFVKLLLEKEEEIKEKYGVRKVFGGPADSAIFTVQDGESIADKHEKLGIHWEIAKKGAGSRVHAWQQIRQMLANSKEFPMEDKGLFVTEDCIQFRRTVPSMQRDPKNPDDIDTATEDHICDEVGYMCRWEQSVITTMKIRGF